MAIQVQVKPQKTTISSVTVARTANISLSQINDVQTANTVDGHVLTYEAGSGKFVMKEVPKIQGGTF